MTRLMSILLAGLLSTAVHAGAGKTHGTAAVLDKGEWEVGLYTALRRGMGDGLELSIHPLTAILSPHIAVKKAWVREGDWHLASRHSLIYPTPLLRFLAREGTGGIIVADATIPHIIAADNRLLLSRDLTKRTTLSLRGRMMLGAELGESSWPTIDMPLAYTRTAAYQDHLATAAGVQLDGRIWRHLYYRAEIDGWLLPLSEGAWAAEARPSLIWRPTGRFTTAVGATGIVAEYPYGRAWHVLPSFDLIWGW